VASTASSTAHSNQDSVNVQTLTEFLDASAARKASRLRRSSALPAVSESKSERSVRKRQKSFAVTEAPTPHPTPAPTPHPTPKAPTHHPTPAPTHHPTPVPHHPTPTPKPIDRFADWKTKTSATLESATPEITAVYSKNANASIVGEKWNTLPQYKFSPGPPTSKTSISVSNNGTVTLTFVKALTQTPLFYFKIWTPGTYVFSEDFTVKSVSNTTAYTKSAGANGTQHLVLTAVLDGIFLFPKTTTKIHWAATPKNDVRQIYFEIALPH